MSGMAVTIDMIAKLAHNWTISHCKMRDGWPVRVAFWSAAQPTKGYVLLAPGTHEFIEKSTLRAREWGQRGYRAISFDWRGQGGSGRLVPEEPQMCHIDKVETYRNDMSDLMQNYVRPQIGNSFLVVEAHSSGAHILARALAHDQQSVDAFIASSPFVRVITPAKIPYPVAETFVHTCAKRWAKKYAMGEGPKSSEKQIFALNKITHNEEYFQWWIELSTKLHPELATIGPSWGWVDAMMRSARMLPHDLERIKIPTLAILTPNDPRVDGKAEELFPQHLPHCVSVRFPDAFHETHMETDDIRARRWMETDNFLEESRRNLAPHRRKELGL